MFSTCIIVLSITALFFMKLSNDHSECEVVTQTTVSEDGLTTTTTKRHSCNEKFNL